ncbi:M48 family metalloprotease [Fusobacterium animalis]
MNKLLNDALRAKGYAGPDIKMVLTDVTDSNGPYYTDTLTNTVVFDRTMLANANRDEILNALGHEFGHYSKEDNKTGTQTIANYSGEKLEDRTKGMVSKKVTEDTLGGNKADFGTDVNLSKNRIKIGGSGGYVHVFEWKNPSEATKVLIRTIANDSEKIVNDKNVMGKLIDITRKIMKQRDVLK